MCSSYRETCQYLDDPLLARKLRQHRCTRPPQQDFGACFAGEKHEGDASVRQAFAHGRAILLTEVDVHNGGGEAKPFYRLQGSFPIDRYVDSGTGSAKCGVELQRQQRLILEYKDRLPRKRSTTDFHWLALLINCVDDPLQKGAIGSAGAPHKATTQ